MIQMTKNILIFGMLVMTALVGCSEDSQQPQHTIQSVAMRPTLEPGEKVSIVPLEQGDPKRFDLVLVKAPVVNIDYVFRVVGLPNDVLEFREEGLIVNGDLQLLPDGVGYVAEGQMPNHYGLESSIEVPADRFFVIGDNMAASRDSRTFGLVPSSRILGKVEK